MKRLLAKLPRSSNGSREASANSRASRLPFAILHVSLPAHAGLSGFALVSSPICFSGASSGDLISSLTDRARPPGAPLFNSTDGSTSRPYQITIHKTSFRRARAFSRSRRAQISLRFVPAVPFLPRFSLARNVPRNAMARPGTARNRFPMSFHSLRPPANRRPSLPRNEQLRSPSERLPDGPARLRLALIADHDASPAE